MTSKIINTPKSFLIINPYGIGDVFFSTPLIRNLKEAFPDSKIYYMSNQRVAPLIEHHPLITKLFIYENDEFETLRKRSFFQWLKKMLAFLGSIRKERISLAFDLSLNPKFGFFALYAGIAKRIGFDYKRRGRFLNVKIPLNGFHDKHVTEYYLDLLRLQNIPIVSKKIELYISDANREWAKNYLQTKNPENKPIVCIAPCGGATYGVMAYIKRWPLEYYMELVKGIMDTYDVNICLVAGPKEKEEIKKIYDSIQRNDRIFDTIGITIGQSAALVEQCELLVSNDAGPVRIANALDKKIVAIFGPVDEKEYGLYPLDPEKHIQLSLNLDCRPCYRHPRLSDCTNEQRCLTDISVDTVMASVERLMNKE